MEATAAETLEEATRAMETAGETQMGKVVATGMMEVGAMRMAADEMGVV